MHRFTAHPGVRCPSTHLRSTKIPTSACLRTGQRENGAPDRIRTCDPLLRRQVLYPTELRALSTGRIAVYSGLGKSRRVTAFHDHRLVVGFVKRGHGLAPNFDRARVRAWLRPSGAIVRGAGV